MYEINNDFFIQINVLPLLLLQFIVTTLIIVMNYKYLNFKKILKIFLINYIIFLVGINVFPVIMTSQHFPFNNWIVKPFSNASYSIIHCVGIILLFVPIGLYCKNLKKAIIFSSLLGIIIESCKFLGRVKVPDLTYILFCIIGAVLGVMMLKYLSVNFVNAKC